MPESFRGGCSFGGRLAPALSRSSMPHLDRSFVAGWWVYPDNSLACHQYARRRTPPIAGPALDRGQPPLLPSLDATSVRAGEGSRAGGETRFPRCRPAPHGAGVPGGPIRARRPACSRHLWRDCDQSRARESYPDLAAASGHQPCSPTAKGWNPIRAVQGGRRMCGHRRRVSLRRPGRGRAARPWPVPSSLDAASRLRPWRSPLDRASRLPSSPPFPTRRSPTRWPPRALGSSGCRPAGTSWWWIPRGAMPPRSCAAAAPFSFSPPARSAPACRASSLPQR